MGVLRGGVALRSRPRFSLDEDALEPTGTTDIAGTEISPSSGSSSLDSPKGLTLTYHPKVGKCLMPCRMHLSHEVRLTYADAPRFKLRPLENLCYNRCWKPVHLLRLSCSLRQCQVNEKVLGRPLQIAGGGQPPRDTRFARVPWQGGEGVGAERGIRGARSARRRALGLRLADRHLRQGLLRCGTP